LIFFFFFNDTATTEIYTLSLHDALPISTRRVVELGWCKPGQRVGVTAGLPSGKPGTTSLFQVQEL